MTGIMTRRLWLAAGWLTIGFVVLTFIGAAFQDQVVLGDKPSRLTAGLVTSSLSKNFTGGYIELIATLVFLVAALLVARLVRGDGELSGWLSSCASGAAVAFVAVTIATSFAAGAAALYDGHHGAPLATVTAVTDIRDFGYSLSAALVGTFALAISGAAQVTRILPRWLVYAGYVVGIVCIAAVPAVKAGAPQTLLWFAWLVVVGVVALRRSRVTRPVAHPAVSSA
jgi:hypothetical protein